MGTVGDAVRLETTGEHRFQILLLTVTNEEAKEPITGSVTKWKKGREAIFLKC